MAKANGKNGRNGNASGNGRNNKGQFTPGNPFAYVKGKCGDDPNRWKGGHRKHTYAKLSAAADEVMACKEPWAVRMAKVLGLDPKKYTVAEILVRTDKISRAKGNAAMLREDNNRCEGRVPIRAEVQIEMKIGFNAAAEILFRIISPMLTEQQLTMVSDGIRDASAQLSTSSGRHTSNN